MVVYPQLQGFEKGGLAVVAAAYNQGNSLADSHAGEFAPVGQVQGDRQLLGRTDGDSLFHGQGGDTGGPGQDAPISHKGAQAHLGQRVANILLVLRQISDGLEMCRIQITVKQGVLHAPGEQIKENFLQLPGVDGAAIGGKTDLQA